MSITKKIVKHIADLAKIDVSEKELAGFTSQLSDVLGYFEILEELKTENVTPTNQVTGLKNIFREDVACDYPEDKRDKLFREVPKMKDGFVVVPHSIKKLN